MLTVRRSAVATLAVVSLAIGASAPAAVLVAGVTVPQSQDDQVQLAKKGSFDITEFAETP